MDDIQSRGKVLESAFFGQRDQVLLQKLRAEIEGKAAREALRSVSGVDNDSALDQLIAVGVTPESLTAVSLIPLVSVAWCDNTMETKEKAAILEAAKSSGIAANSAAAALLDSWLDSNPKSDLLDAWKAYIDGLKEKLDETSLSQLKATVIERAETVAESAGGILGLGSVSDKEKKAIAELTAAFG